VWTQVSVCRFSCLAAGGGRTGLRNYKLGLPNVRLQLPWKWVRLLVANQGGFLSQPNAPNRGEVIAGLSDAGTTRKDHHCQSVTGACMYSPFSSALIKLDGSLQAIQSQLDSLRAGLEIDDAQLSQSLMEARQHAATLRDLIRADRPDATWNDRNTLDQLVRELDIAAKARRDELRRTKLLELATELDAGRVQHRFDARTTTLNTLRLEAVKELRTEAALEERENDLPGPNPSDWLHWACNLQDSTDAVVLVNLRRDFPAVERFAGEMEERYWIPGQRVRVSPRPPSESLIRPAEESAALMNSAIGIRDSYLTSITKRGKSIEVRLKAYIHKSEGTPGVDPGTGWTQDVTLLFGNGMVDGSITAWPADLYDGTLEIDGQASENIIPIPLDREGTIVLTLRPKFANPVAVCGSSLRLELQGVATFVEEFPVSTTR